ncbi:hypothetical protein MKK62_18115 [Mycobacterium paraterrae]|uniref:PPE family protein n=2 Tax=Mycobacterium paraterrae TaxID=577492 RepID=A0ABY3VZW7_9MYCO|nr:hypothetical protein MKK62_18115 [Mycobacterium paraterrae]
MSVPPTWGSAPAIRLASAEMPIAGGGLGAVPEAGVGAPGGMFGGIPPVGSVVNAPRNGEGRLRPPSRARVIPAIAAAPGAAHGDALERGPQASRPGSEDSGSLSDQERAELDALREEMAELAMERDAAARLIREAIR